jgi:hypothetical protein
MEPDQLKTLREKISSLEQQPVLWRKDFVWQEIIAKSDIRSTSFRWYSVAAVFLTGLLGIISIFYQRQLQDSNDKRIGFLEKQIEFKENSIRRYSTGKEETCPLEMVTISPRISNSVKTKNLTAEKPPVNSEQTVAIVQIDSINSYTNTFTDESNISPGEIAQLKTVMPVIGKIPKGKPILENKERLVRIKLAKKDRIEITTQKEAKGLLARIN